MISLPRKPITLKTDRSFYNANVANQFSYGLFTYVFRHPSGQEFEVLSYWVE